MKNLFIIMLLITFTANSQVEKMLEIANNATSYYPSFESVDFNYPASQIPQSSPTTNVTINNIQAQSPVILDNTTIYNERTINPYNSVWNNVFNNNRINNDSEDIQVFNVTPSLSMQQLIYAANGTSSTSIFNTKK